MKKYLNYAFAGAIALTGAVGFSSCSSSEDVSEVVNPGNQTDDVPVNFIVNISTNSTQGSTRQSDNATQATASNFRGIDNNFIFTKRLDTDGKHISEATTMDKTYDMARVMGAGTITKDHSRRVLEMALPINTNSIMFYGKAVRGAVTERNTDHGLTINSNDILGKLKNYTVNSTLDNILFEVDKRLSTDGDVKKYRLASELLGGMLTCIMNTNLKGANHVLVDEDGFVVPITGTGAYQEFAWKDYAVSEKSPAFPTKDLTQLEVKLSNLYKEITTINSASGELRCGSGHALKTTLQALWSTINDVRCATPTDECEAVAKYFAKRVDERLRSYLNATVTDDGKPVTNTTLKTADNIADHFVSDEAWPAGADWFSDGDKPITKDYFNDLGTMDMNKFPHNFNLPDGATHIACSTITDGSPVISYIKNYNTSGMGNQPDATAESYYYPPELLYFGNSPIRVSDLEHNDNDTDFPKTVAQWVDDTKWDNTWTKNKHVISTTRSVAMVNDINYGTSLLNTTVGYKTLTLKDNNHAIQVAKHPGIIGENEEPDKEITVGDQSFELVGVIVGGQPKAVGWNFLRKQISIGSEVKNVYGMVYDIDIAEDASQIPANTSKTTDPNYTMVFDNYNDAQNGSSTNNQDKVYIALEFHNNAEDFFGQHNLIPKGGHFYLIGELDPSKEGLTAISWPTHHPLPPYNNDGTSNQVKRVFMQDYVTTAKFMIGENSLKYAYLTVPDLRSSSLSLGLSVDIQWSSGLSFEEVILGGN